MLGIISTNGKYQENGMRLKMKADVLLYHQALNQQLINEKKAVVIDVLRATSTIVTALANRADQVIPVNEPMEAIELSRSIGVSECVLGGEQKGFKIEGFDRGNSPVEYTATAVAGKKVILCTTNGTRAIKRAQGAAEVLIGSYLNGQAVVEHLDAGEQDVLFLCAGREFNLCLEDLACAGMLVQALQQRRSDLELTDAAMLSLFVTERAHAVTLERFLANTQHGQYLIANGMGADLSECAVRDKYAIVPRYLDGKVVGGL
jgi:2-phosphosulfolactate phosphatase